MASRKRLQSVTLLCTLGVLGWVSVLAADQVKPPPAGAPPAGAPPKPQITDVQFLKLSPAPRAELAAPAAKAKLVHANPEVRFLLAIKGKELPCNHTPEVLLQTQDPGKPIENQEVICLSPEEIHVAGEAPVGTVITALKVTTGGCKEASAASRKDGSPGAAATDLAAARVAQGAAVRETGQCTPPSKDNPGDSSCSTATSTAFTISIKPISPQSALQEFGIKFEHQQSKEFPNLHSLLVTKETGDAEVGFAANPNHMSIDLEPTGATDLRVVQSNEEQMELHFVAAADYVPTNVVITVYDKSDLDTRTPWFVGKLVAAANPGAPDPNAPVITLVDTVFLDRHEGNGRIRIYGKGFGKNTAPPPYPVDDFLCDCLERPPLGLPKWERFRTCGTLSKDLGRDVLVEGEKEGLTPEAQKYIAELADARSAYCGLPQGGGIGAITAGSRLEKWMQWQCKVGAVVGVNSRNPDIRVDKTKIIDINDEMIDVYFEFTRHHGYAWPFRLASVELTLPVTTKKVEQVVTLATAKVAGEVASAAPTTVHLSRTIGPQPDQSLTYRYTVLSKTQAQQLLGDGVADNFHVMQLAVVNDGAKKVAIPLAGMQAEIEWLYGTNVREPGGFFLEGPATLPPVPMSTVSAYFGASKKSTERRVRVFNALQGITTLVGAIIPFAGIGLKDAEVVFSSGFIPGLQHVWVDISDQQLQNLTALSWQTSETLAANGGSIEKLIYIQRREEFRSDPHDIADPPRFTEHQLGDIMGLEITGYEINDGPAKQATPAGKSPASSGKETTSTPSKPTSGSTGTTIRESSSGPA